MTTIALEPPRGAIAAGAGGRRGGLQARPRLAGLAADGPRLLAVRGTPAEAEPGDAGDVRRARGRSGGHDRRSGARLVLLPHAEARPPRPTRSAASAWTRPTTRARRRPSWRRFPNDGCMTFGPQPPPVQPGQPQIRPRDPDATGGFYQPLRVTLQAASGTDVAFELERISCMLANAPIDVIAHVRQHLHEEPQSRDRPASRWIPTARADAALSAPAAATAPSTVAPGATVTLELGWAGGRPRELPGL